jgi:hypothetical protein
MVEKPTVDSINTNAEWFFVGFTRVTGTEIHEEDRAEVDKVSTPSYKRGGPNLIVSSGVRVTLTAEGVVVNIKGTPSGSPCRRSHCFRPYKFSTRHWVSDLIV